MATSLLKDPNPLYIWPWLLGSEALAAVGLVLFRLLLKD